MDIFMVLGFAFGGLVLLFLILSGMGRGEPRDRRDDSEAWLGDGDYDGGD